MFRIVVYYIENEMTLNTLFLLARGVSCVRNTLLKLNLKTQCLQSLYTNSKDEAKLFDANIRPCKQRHYPKLGFQIFKGNKKS